MENKKLPQYGRTGAPVVVAVLVSYETVLMVTEAARVVNIITKNSFQIPKTG